MKVRVNGSDIEVSYAIIGADKVKGRVRVRCWTEAMPEGFVHWVDLPIQGGAVLALQGDELERHIIGVFPMGEFSRAVATKPDFAYLEALVEPDPVAPAGADVAEPLPAAAEAPPGAMPVREVSA